MWFVYLIVSVNEMNGSASQWRLSFSRAEIVLLNSWISLQQFAYHMLRVFVKLERLTDSANNSGAATLSNYHIKTLIMWACELKPRSWWNEDLNVVSDLPLLLNSLFHDTTLNLARVHFESQHQKSGIYCLLVSVILHQSLHFAGI